MHQNSRKAHKGMKHTSRPGITLSEEDVCFDDPWRRCNKQLTEEAKPPEVLLQSPAQPSESWKLPQDWGLVERLHALVIQHQTLIDQLSIELAIERAARISLEEKVSSLQTAATAENRRPRWSEIAFEEN